MCVLRWKMGHRLGQVLSTFCVKLADIGYEGNLLDASDSLLRRIQIYRLPDDNPHTSVRIERKLEPQIGMDNPFYVRITLEDGTQAWSSPIYVLREIENQ